MSMIRQQAYPIYHHVADRDPAYNDNPPVVPYMWLNGVSGELFTCIDNSLDWNVWQGALGTLVDKEPSAGMIMPDGAIAVAVLDGYWLFVKPSSGRAIISPWGVSGDDTPVSNMYHYNSDTNDGVHNTDILVTLGASYACALHCRSLGSEWFLPGQNELNIICPLRDMIDAVDETGTDMSFSRMSSELSTHWIVSSSEYSSSNAVGWAASSWVTATVGKTEDYIVIPTRRVFDHWS